MNGGTLELSGVEAREVRVSNASLDDPVLSATDSLFEVLSATGLVALDSCTVLDKAYLTAVQATAKPGRPYCSFLGPDIASVPA